MRRALGIVLALSCLAPAAAQAQADQTCVLALTRFDPATVNFLYPDDSAQYWSGVYHAVPGTRIRIDGRFPHARYMSFNVYDPPLRPLDAIADFEITPEPGSSNPYRAGADRTAPNRDYTVFVEFGPKPPDPKPNTIYTGTAQNGGPNTTGVLTYRIYIPDKGRDEFGDVGLPTVTIQPANGQRAAPSACSETSKPTVEGFNEQLRDGSGFAQTENTAHPGRNPPVWRKFTNLFGALGDNLTDSDEAWAKEMFEFQRGLELHERGGNGGFLSNIHNAYVSAFVNRAYGRVLVTRMTMPTFPDTHDGQSAMGTGQLRYWSMCQNDPPTQRFVDCLRDDEVVADGDGLATFVMTTTGEKPANARPECGINWLPWGNGARGILIYRHMLPVAAFTQSIQAATFEQESATMGAYLPASSYLKTVAEYEARGCVAPGPAALLRSANRRASCTWLLRLPKGARKVRVFIDGKLRRTLRGKAMRRPLKLRGRQVRVVVQRRGKRALVLKKRLRGCER